MHPRPPHHHHRSPSHVGAVYWGLWLSRWLLVLLLAWDQVGSPLHQHHHDSGVDAAWPAAAHDDGPAEALHLEAFDGGPSFGHAVMAVQPPTRFDAPTAGSDAQPALVQAFAQPIPLAAAVQSTGWLDLHPPDLPSCRCLPPAGRAPPRHA